MTDIDALIERLNTVCDACANWGRTSENTMCKWCRERKEAAATLRREQQANIEQLLQKSQEYEKQLVQLANFLGKDARSGNSIAEITIAEIKQLQDEIKHRQLCHATEVKGLQLENRCPCTIADEPCQPNCTCVKPFMSHGCLCCARYGSDEQRKAKAKHIVQIMQSHHP